MENYENSNDGHRLEELGGSNYEIVDGEPDIKGWDVKNAKGEKVGEVDDLLFDPQSHSVRYLVVDLDDNELELENDDRKVLIPIGLAELYRDDVDDDDRDVNDDASMSSGRLHEHGMESDNELVDEDDADFDQYSEGARSNRTERIVDEDEDRVDDDDDDDDTVRDAYDDGDVVILPNITVEQLNALPTYEKDGVTPAIESNIRSILSGTDMASSTTPDNDFYSHEHFNEDRLYNAGRGDNKIPVIKEDLHVGKREVETGGASITSRIVARPVQENVNLKEEHVTVERTPVNRPINDADQPFRETEIEMTEHAEVPVVSKEARVVEEVSLNKEVEEKEQIIRDTVRNTEIDTEKLPGENPEGHTRTRE